MTAKRPPRTVKYPCLLLQLEPHDNGYSSGYRFAVEQADYDRNWFQKLDGPLSARAFMETHDLFPLSEAEMTELRMERGIPVQPGKAPPAKT